jgi:hypothetical protein
MPFFSNEIWLALLAAVTAAVTWVAKLLVKIFKRKEAELVDLREENTDLKVNVATMEAYATKRMAKHKSRDADGSKGTGSSNG